MRYLRHVVATTSDPPDARAIARPIRMDANGRRQAAGQSAFGNPSGSAHQRRANETAGSIRSPAVVLVREPRARLPVWIPWVGYMPGGSRTVSMTWMTPLEASMSVEITLVVPFR